MANVEGYTATIVAGSFTSAHDIQYTGVVTDNHGVVLADFTGANAVSLLAVLNTLTAAQGLAFADLAVNFLLRVKFPSAYANV